MLSSGSAGRTFLFFLMPFGLLVCRFHTDAKIFPSSNLPHNLPFVTQRTITCNVHTHTHIQ